MGIKKVSIIVELDREAEINVEIDTLEALAEQIDRQIELLRCEKDALQKARLLNFLDGIMKNYRK